MKIQQTDILGNSHDISSKQEPKKNTSSWKNFPKIDLNIGLNALQLEADYMLILRIMQKRLAANGINKKFIKIFKNELYIKLGKRDIVSAIRDSLIEYCLQTK